MDGRLGNGMALWLGGALLAHAALLAMPSARAPDGTSALAGRLNVRLTAPGAASDQEQELTTLAALPPATDLPARGTPTRVAPALVNSAAAPTPTQPQPSEPIAAARLASQADTPVSTATGVTAAPPGPLVVATSAEMAAEMGSDPISALSEPSAEKVSDTFPDASTALAGQQAILAAARQTRVETLTLDNPVQSPAGAADARDRLRLLELTDRLHQAIERQKRYPLSARRLGREGTASVAFRLRPDGAIDDLEVAATSGEPALDRAALRAVSGISPFGEARAYLDRSAPFRVDIAFRLH